MLNLKIDSTMDYKKVAESINKDIENGVYDKFPNLRDRLKFISKKVSKLSVLSNATPLSNGEINTLKFQGYLE